MSTIKERIEKDYLTAYKEKNEVVLSSLRLLKSAILYQEKAGKEVLESDILDVLKSQIKKYKDSIELYETNNRSDLALKEKQQMEAIVGYLPAQLNEEDARAMIISLREKLAPEDQNNFGKVMGVVMKELKGKVDGGVINKIVKEIVK